MKPVSPVIKTVALNEVIYAKDSTKYLPLPAFRYDDGTVLMRWKMTFWERVRALFVGDVYVWLLTFNDPLQPINLQVEPPKMECQV
jgi:hypothetical protein